MLSTVTFHDWINDRKLPYWGTNFGAQAIAFQRWRHFKEAFAPEIIERAFKESEIPVNNCLDPFGGSGTTALACQFLGINPITIEINPYLSDLINAKLATYDINKLIKDYSYVVKKSFEVKVDIDEFKNRLPKTFVEPGVEGRWIFDKLVAERICRILAAIDLLSNDCNSRLLKVLLGGILVDVSNAIVNGKGRRYRKNWKDNPASPTKVDRLFQLAVDSAISDITRFSKRSTLEFSLLRGDSRKELNKISTVDLCVFSPPYPNSFDYTDVYNIELWILGYLKSSLDNITLRKSTLSSHVQTKREYLKESDLSFTLDETLNSLNKVKNQLWNKDIPLMVGAYFSELESLLNEIYCKLNVNAKLWMIVGDSKYSDAYIPVAKILIEIATKIGYSIETSEEFRSMRSSAQQGGQKILKETLLVFKKNK